MSQKLAVRARGISRYFGNVIALDEVTLDVPAGEIHGLIGPNGAGKTTLLGLLLGLASSDAGSLEVLGAPAGRALGVADGVAGFVDGPGLYPALTARQNLRAVARLRRLDPAGVEPALERVGLGDVADDRARGFSLGMRQRLGLAAALLTRPRLLVLDEPSNGLDPAAAAHVHRVLTEAAAEGTCVVVSSHRMDDLAALCTHVSLLAAGRVVFSGSVDKLAAEQHRIDYRVHTSSPAAARQVAGATPGLVVLPGDAPHRHHADELVVRGPALVIEELVARLVNAGVGVRGVAPVMPPLEAAFLALTEAATDGEL